MASDQAAPDALTLAEVDAHLADYTARLARARHAGDATDERLIRSVIDSLLDRRSVAVLELQCSPPGAVAGAGVRGET
jgi:hypothetical protein